MQVVLYNGRKIVVFVVVVESLKISVLVFC